MLPLLFGANTGRALLPGPFAVKIINATHHKYLNIILVVKEYLMIIRRNFSHLHRKHSRKLHDLVKKTIVFFNKYIFFF